MTLVVGSLTILFLRNLVVEIHTALFLVSFISDSRAKGIDISGLRRENIDISDHIRTECRMLNKMRPVTLL